VSPEKGLVFGRSVISQGNLRGAAPQRCVYKHVPERTGAKGRVLYRDRYGTRAHFCSASQDAGSMGLQRRIELRKPAETTTRRKAPWVVPPFSLSGREINSPTREDGGTILATRVKRASKPRERGSGAAASGRFGTDPAVPAGDKRRQRTERIRSRLLQPSPSAKKRGELAVWVP